jgi:hypothetical protein
MPESNRSDHYFFKKRSRKSAGGFKDFDPNITAEKAVDLIRNDKNFKRGFSRLPQALDKVRRLSVLIALKR